MAEPVPLVRIVRGRTLESIHRGSYAVWARGSLVRHAGDITRPVFYRSTAKPFQALVAVTSGAADRFKLSERELAVATGSHNASPAHMEVVGSMLRKAGLKETQLGCGGHLSLNPARSAQQLREWTGGTQPYPPIWSNCSGKHSAFLASALAMGAPTATYLDPDHPVQRVVRAHVLAFSGLGEADVPGAVDGCGAPIHAVPLEHMARSLALLASPKGVPDDLAHAAQRIAGAMALHPEMVAGENRFDTDLMRTAGGGLLAKGGAEGVQGVAVPQLDLGIAIKVDDGSDRGYRLLVIELLRDLGVLTDAVAHELAERQGRTLTNHAGVVVGHLEALL